MLYLLAVCIFLAVYVVFSYNKQIEVVRDSERPLETTPQEAQEDPSDSEQGLDALDDGSRYSLVIVRWEGEPLAGLPEGASLGELFLFIEEVYSKDYIFGYNKDTQLIFTGLEAVEEIQVIKAIRREDRPLDQPIVTFRPRK